MGAVTIEELEVPAAVGAEGWDEFAAASAVRGRAEAKWFATPDRAYEPEEELPHFQDPHRPARLFVARSSGTILGTGWVEVQIDDPDASWVVVTTDPDAEGRGVGRGLMDAVEAAARAASRSRVIAYVPEHRTDGERRVPPTGFGSVPATSRSTRFMDARGYRLEQVNRLSRLELPVAGIEERLAAAIEGSGSDFALHHWTGPTPERWREGIATLYTRMSTDPPDGGVGTPEDVWDAGRVASEDARRQRDDPRIMVTTAVEHLPTGELAGYTVYSLPRQSHRPAQQYNTLVLPEHRGHGLGMLLKLANLRYLDEEFPGHPSALTFNAEENRPMLEVNEALGFVPVSYEGIWRKDL
ncbi:MAG: GNAT family N-acetyltransferase [Protaetiibacter sp.]